MRQTVDIETMVKAYRCKCPQASYHDCGLTIGCFLERSLTSVEYSRLIACWECNPWKI